MSAKVITAISILLCMLLFVTNQSFAGWPPDTTPPTPNPMEWYTMSPYANGTTSVFMRAKTASDPSGGIQYYFDETSGNPGGTYSGWQSSRTYVDDGLNSDTTYTYRVKARDLHGNETAWSTDGSATPGPQWDSDNDNLPDAWETANYLNPNDANDADTDLDGDNYNNLCEYLHNTDPNDDIRKPNNSSYIMTIYVPADVYTIQRAIWAAISGDTIEVSEGTYYEVVDFNGVSCTLTGTDPNDWQVVANTIIVAANPTVNVITFTNSEDAAVLTGLTITGGECGIYCNGSSPAVSNCLINGNGSGSSNGGGMCITNSSSPALTNCFFVENDANFGGGVYDFSSSPVFTSCVFAGNAAGEDGGAIYDVDSSLTLINCTFSGNTADSNGGGMYSCGTSEPNVINCIFWGNKADNDGNEILNANSADPHFRFSCLEGCGGYPLDPNFGSDDGNNIDIDPAFVDAYDAAGPDGVFGTLDDGLILHTYSICMDAADGGSAPDADIIGRGRFDIAYLGNEGVGTPDYADIGAYESPVIWFVNKRAGGNDNGSSWTDAFRDLQDALDDAKEGDQIWVTKGTYKPDINNRTISFEMVEGVAIYGGFYGNEVSRDQRDWILHKTILSGDIGTTGDANDNSYHVLVGADGAILDGFTVTGGNANYASPYNHGAGIYCYEASPTIRNCTISDNHATLGGGMSNESSSPTLTNCIFWNNGVTGYGGGIWNLDSSPTLTNCVFSGNTSQSGGGGILNISAFDDCLPTLINCTFSNNSAGEDGGGMYNHGPDCSPVVTNCIFWGNEAVNDGNEIYNYSTAPNFKYCDIEGCGGSGGGWDLNFGTDGGGNIDSDPLLEADNYHLQTGSPCINNGDPGGDYAGQKDIDGERRVVAGRVDIGADEFRRIIYVDAKADAGGDGSSWLKAFDDLQSALGIAEPGDEIWVAAAENPYTPGASRTDSFVLEEDVAVYGGFAGGESSLEERDLVKNKTILSGDIDDDDVNSMPDPNNSSNVVTIEDVNSVLLDGFVILGGYLETSTSTDSDPNSGGAGIICINSSPEIRNCHIRYNHIFNGLKGAAFYSSNDSSPTLINCIIAGNIAAGNNAGAIYHNGDSMNLINCTVANNSGDGIHIDSFDDDVNDGASVDVDNCIIWQNRTDVNEPAYPIREICLYNDASANISYSSIEGGESAIVQEPNVPSGTPVLTWDSNTNISTDPNFVQWGYWDWRLTDGTDLIVGQTALTVNPNDVTIYDFGSQPDDFARGSSSYEDHFVGDYLVDKKPYWDPCKGACSTISNETSFDLWWNAAEDIHKGLGHYNLEVPWLCEDDDKGIFEFNSEHFFPFDSNDLGSGDQSMAACSDSNCSHYPGQDNWYFTLQYHTACTYVPGMTLYFKSSDDIFVAINNRVVIERGGNYIDHASETELIFDSNGTVTVRYVWADPAEDDETYDFALGSDSVYDFDLFYAQRHKNTESDPVLIVQRTGSETEMLPFYVPGDYHLLAGSPCIDAGDNDLVPIDVAVDNDSGQRFFDALDTPDTGNGGQQGPPIVDMGAYEYRLNRSPVANDDMATTIPGQEVDINILANDSDPDPGNTLTFEKITQSPSNGTVDQNDGVITYTPTTSNFVGEDTFKYIVKDDEGALSNEATVLVTVENPLRVEAGNYEPIELPVDFVNLDGEIIGDPGNLVDATTWSVSYVDAGCSANISDTGILNPTATFSVDGRYVLRLVAQDSNDNVLGSDEAVIIVKNFLLNDPPDVNAGSYGPVTLPNDLDLDGTVTDDGLPFGKEIIRWTLDWCDTAGGTAAFGDCNSEDTTVQFNMAGTYRLELWASDTDLNTVDYTEIVVQEGALQNHPPVVNAGSDYVIDWNSVEDNVVLDLNDLACPPSVEDQDDPTLENVDISWSVSIGDVLSVTFDAPNAVIPMVTFTKAGTYVLELKADDGEFSDTDEVRIDVNIPGSYTELTVDASLDPVEDVEEGQVILPDKADLYGSVTGGTAGITVEWSVFDGPAPVTFESYSAQDANTKATFSKVGEYILKLEAKDGLVTAADMVTVKVKPGTVLTGGENHSLIIDDTDDRYVWACGADGINYDLDPFNPLDPYKGALGTGDHGDGYYESIFVQVHSGAQGSHYYLRDIETVAGGWKHSLALDSNSNVWAWGSDEDPLGNPCGQLGNGNSAGDSNVPVQVLSGEQGEQDYLEDIVYIAAGRSGTHSLAVSADGHVWAWGNDYFGQLGNGGVDGSSQIPVEVHAGEQNQDPCSLVNIIAVSGGAYHSMALEKLELGNPDCNGRVYTFGENCFFVPEGYFDGYGKLGIGSNPADGLPVQNNRQLPVCVLAGAQNQDVNLVNIVAISAGWHHSMALEMLESNNPDCNGRVYTWGYNDDVFNRSGGRLGDGYSSGVNDVPVQVVGLENITAISAGESHNMALDENGYVWTWGDNYYGELGDNTWVSSPTPVKVVAPDRNFDGSPDDLDGDGNSTNDYLGDDVPIIAIAAGYWHCLAMDETGAIYSWGSNGSGKLGIDSNVDVYEIIPDENIPQVVLPFRRVLNLRTGEWYGRIQLAIDAASDDDEIVVYPGVFNEQVVFDSGKDVILRSLDPGDPDIVAGTIIDGSGVVPDYGAVIFNSGSASTLYGFTINESNLDGIYCSSSSSPTISNNIVYNNQTGIYCYYSSPEIKNNVIYNNSSYGIECTHSSPEITNNVIHKNWSGINCGYSIEVKITNNLIFENGKDIDESGVGVGGIRTLASDDITIRNNTIVANDGYGLWGDSYSGTVAVRNCIIWNNGDDGNDNLYQTFDDVSYCCIEPEEGYSGTNITDEPNFVNAWEFSDETTSSGSINNICVSEANLYDFNDIIEYDNDDIMRTVIDVDTTNDIVTFDPNLGFNSAHYATIYNWGKDATSVISDFHLQANSPCINGGDPSGDYSGEVDIDSDPRKMGAYVDIGADEYPPLLVDAGEDKEITIVETLSLDDAVVIDNGLPNPPDPNNWEYLWSVFSAPDGATVTFSDTSDSNSLILDPNVTFDRVGIYILELEVYDDNTNLLGRGTVQIKVNPWAGDDQVLIWPDNDVNLIDSDANGAASVEWVQFWGPAPVNFVDGTEPCDLNPKLEFAGIGIYGLELFAIDAAGGVIGSDSLWVTVRHEHLTVDAGTYPAITLSDNGTVTLELAGTISGSAAAYTLWVAHEWVEFDDNSKLNTAVTFKKARKYTLELRAYDEFLQLIGADVALITVNAASGDQQEPPITVVASFDPNEDVDVGEVFLPNTLDLYGWVDGNMPEGVTMEWSGPADIENISGWQQIRAEFSEPGVYCLTLSAKDNGEIIDSDTVQVTVNQDTVRATASPDELSISETPVQVQLDGDILGDEPANVRYLWWLYSFTGQVQGDVEYQQASNQFDEDPTVTFTEPGIYKLLFEVFTGDYIYDSEHYIGSDIVTITVNPENQAPIVKAGLTKRGIEGEGIELFDAYVWDEDEIGNLELVWQVEGSPSGVTFNPAHPGPPEDPNESSALNPTVTFDSADTYTLKLTVTDTGNKSGFGTVTVYVGIPGQDPNIGAGSDKTITLPKYTEYLDDAWIVPALTGTVEWEAIGVPYGGYVGFINPANPTATPVSVISILRPLVTFSQTGDANDVVTGDYILELRLSIPGQDDLASQVTITVNASDTNAPEITAFYATIDGVSIDDGNNLNGLIDIVVVAEDENLDQVTLELDKGEQGARFIEPDNTEILKGVPYDLQKLRLTYSIHTYHIGAGPHTLTATATDSADNGPTSQEINFSISDSPTIQPPVARITSWEDEANFVYDFTDYIESLTVVDKGLFKLKGAVYLPDNNSNVDYKIELFRPQISDFTVECWNDDCVIYDDYFVTCLTSDGGDGFISGKIGDDSTDGVIPSPTGDFLDLTGVENGEYQLLLTVRTGTPGSYLYEYDNVGFILDNQLKIGNVKFSQEDLVIPVGGMPLRVVRTYNSFNKAIDSDFGYGWSYTIANMDIELNERRRDVPLYGGDKMSLRDSSNFNRDVTLTLPNGQRTTFYFYLDGSNYARYEAPPGGSATLTVSPAQQFSNQLQLWKAQCDSIVPDGWQHKDYYEFPGFTLKTADGTKYIIERKQYSSYIFDVLDELNTYLLASPCGPPYLSHIITPSNEKIDLNVSLSNGKIGDIEHYAKDDYINPTKKIEIEYDSSGHIEGIWAPSEQNDEFTGEDDIPTIKYVYDQSTGDLLEVRKLVDKNATEPEYETTTYVYDDGHYIKDIIDSRGLTPIRYIYDNNGLLEQVIDAKGQGHEITIDHDVPAKTETVTDRLGNVTIYGYNERGNVVSVTNALYQTTISIYEDLYNPDKPTEVKVPLVASPSSDADYSITRYEYDDKGRPILVTDPEYNVTKNVYDQLGNVEEISQWRPTDYSEVSRTTNGYYYNDNGTLNLSDGSLTNLLAWTEATVVLDDPCTTGEDETQVELTEYTYDNKNRIETVIKRFDPDGAISDWDIVTTYDYSYADSNSYDQPYRISDAFFRGDVTDIADPFDEVFTRYFGYDDNGNQTNSWYNWEDPNDSGNSCKVATITEYDDAGRVVKTSRQITGATGSIQNYTVELSKTTYNAISKPDTVTNEHGVLTKYEYDELGNLVETRGYADESDYDPDYPDNNDITISQTLYDKKGRVLVTVDAHDPNESANGTENVYDELGRLVETRRWNNVFITFEDLVNPNDSSQKVGRKMPDNVEPANAWDGYGTAPSNIGWTSDGNLPVIGYISDPATQNHPLSHTRTLYDVAGRVKHSVTLDEYGDEQPTTYEYDDAGRQVAIIDPLGHNLAGPPNLYVYDANQDVNTIDFANFDPNEHLTGTHRSETYYQGTRRDYVIDARGFESGADVNDYKTQFVFDAFGRVITTIHPPTVFEGSSGADLTYTHVGYDTLGRKAWQSNQVDEPLPGSAPDDEIKDFEYDAAGRLTAVVLPSVNDPNWEQGHQNDPVYPRTEYEYDDYGNLLTIRDNVKQYKRSWDQNFNPATDINDLRARETSFTYDELHRQRSRALPGSQTEYKAYDDLGRLIKATDFKGQLTIYEYDDRGLLEYESYYVDDANYDSNYPTCNATPEIYYEYDSLGRKNVVTVTKYDSNGTELSSESWDYDYDTEGQIISVTTPQGIVNYEYDPTTGRKGRTYSADTDVDYYYDELGRLSEVTVDKRNDEYVTETTSYTYNEVGSLETITYPNGNYATYTYDSLNRLTNLVHKNSSDTTLASYAYTLAADGMRQSVTEANSIGTTRVLNWYYDALNRLVTEDYNDIDDSNDFEHDYIYDLVGNRLERKVIVGDGNDTIYTYNDNDQLILEFTDANTHYTYNANGSLIEEANDVATLKTFTYDYRNRMASVSVTGGNTVDYEYNPSGIRVAADILGGTATDFLIDPYNHTGYAQVFKEIGDSNTIFVLGHDIIAQATGSNNPKYFLYDGHGSTRHLADNTGALISGQAFNYDAYGNIINSVAPQTSLLYSGEWRDSHSGLDYLRNRWYDPQTGRFNSLDRFPGNYQDPQSLHKYLYVHNNPVNNIDPSGMFSIGEINIVQSIQSKFKQLWNSKPLQFMRRGVSPTRQRWKMWLIRSKGMPVHFGLWLEALNRYGRETGFGPYFDVNPTASGYRSLITGNFSSVLRYFKVVSGKINVKVYPEVAVTGMATGKWKICSFTHAQFGLWATAAVGAAYAEDLAVPVKFNLAFLPGTLNCTKWVAEAITLALPISILPL